MKQPFLAAVLCQFLIGLNVAFCGLLRETGCPPREDVAPCRCNSSPYTILACQRIMNVDVLRSVFQKSVRYSYHQVLLNDSAITFIPHEIFEYTDIDIISLSNVTMVKLFDELPRALPKMEEFVLTNTRTLSVMTWDLFQSFTNLQYLTVVFSNVESFNDNFSQYVSKSLKRVAFYLMETKRIKPGILSQYPNLVQITFDKCKLTELTREIFAVPFSGWYLSFNDNKITSIPDDLFTQMPNLRFLELKNNLIATVPESAFNGNNELVSYAKFDGNPLKCDCLLVWVIRNKPSDWSGSCSAPKQLHGMQLKDLSLRDFNC